MLLPQDGATSCCKKLRYQHSTALTVQGDQAEPQASSSDDSLSAATRPPPASVAHSNCNCNITNAHKASPFVKQDYLTTNGVLPANVST